MKVVRKFLAAGAVAPVDEVWAAARAAFWQRYGREPHVLWLHPAMPVPAVVDTVVVRDGRVPEGRLFLEQPGPEWIVPPAEREAQAAARRAAYDAEREGLEWMGGGVDALAGEAERLWMW